jgi:hypothetical protein
MNQSVFDDFDNFRGSLIETVISDGPLVTPLKLLNNTMICSTDGNPRPNATWFIRHENTTVSYHADPIDVCHLQTIQQRLGQPHLDTEKVELDFLCTASGNGRVASANSNLKLTFKHLDSWCTDNILPTKKLASQLTEMPACPECIADFPSMLTLDHKSSHMCPSVRSSASRLTSHRNCESTQRVQY